MLWFQEKANNLNLADDLILNTYTIQACFCLEQQRIEFDHSACADMRAKVTARVKTK